jgi:hypothetical protein
MFLPHPNPPSGTLTALAVHDSADKAMNANLQPPAVGPQCLMSYHPQRHGFCGFCQLRLRGWDWNSGPTTKLNNTGAANKKP